MTGMNLRLPAAYVVREASAQHIAPQRGLAANARPHSTSHAAGAGNHGLWAYLHGSPGVARPEDVLSLSIEAGRLPALQPLPAETPAPTCCRLETKVAPQH